MQVMQGWSGEVKAGRWAKLDVTLDEVDIARILVGAGISIPAGQVPITLAWQLLDAEAERFMTAKLVRAHNYPGHERLGELAQTIADLLAKIRTATGETRNA